MLPALGRGARTPCRGNERSAFLRGQIEGREQELEGVLARHSAGASFQVADAAGAQPCPLGQALLR